MRIWDIKPKYLCRKHLLGEHRERGYNHYSELSDFPGLQTQETLIATIKEQENILREKPCDCKF